MSDTSIRTERLDAFAEAVCAHLNVIANADWSIVPRDEAEGLDHVVVFTDGTRRFSFYWGYNVSRLEVHGQYPAHPTGSVYPREQPRIGVSIQRDPDAVARDIARRFLPEFIETWDEWAASIAQHNLDAQRAESVAATIAEILGCENWGHEDRSRHAHVGFYPPGTGQHASITVSGDTVAVEAHGLTPDQAYRIARILAEHNQEKP